jgi:O-antigen/teichoic acid export membrane protein
MLNKNDDSKKSVLANIGWLLFDKVFILLMNLVVIFVIANYYGPTLYGTYQYATNIVLILEVVVQLIDARVVKKRYTDKNFDEMVYNVTLAKVFLSTVALLVGSFVAVFSKQDSIFKIILMMLLFDSIIRNLRFGMENRYEYLLQSKRVVIASNVGLFCGTLLQMIVVLVKAPIVYIALIQMCASAISLVVLFVQYKKSFYSSFFGQKIRKDVIISIVRESLPLALATAAATVYTRCDSVMLGAMLSTTEVGIYSISTKLISTVQILVVPIQSTIFVKMIEWQKTDYKLYKNRYLQISSIATWLSIVGILFSFVVLPFIFRFLKPDYLAALDSYKILSIGSVFVYNALLRSSHLTLIKRGDILLKTQLITVVVNVVLNYFLIRSFGMNGAAVATVISQVISLFISNMFYKDARFLFTQQLKAFNPMYIIKKV